MTDRTEDVLKSIRAGARTNRAIQEAVLGGVAYGGYSREIDAALQKLRKAGRIEMVRHEWHDRASRPCRRCHGTGAEPPRTSRAGRGER